MKRMETFSCFNCISFCHQLNECLNIIILHEAPERREVEKIETREFEGNVLPTTNERLNNLLLMKAPGKFTVERISRIIRGK